MKKFLFLFPSFFTTALFAQTPSWVWAQRAGGANTDYAYSVCSSSSGDVYSAGVFYSASIAFGSTTLTNLSTASADIFLVKYDASGNVLWARAAGSAADDAATSVATDASGNVYVTGWFSGASIAFGSYTLVNASPGSGDIFLAKYDAAGNVLWAVRTGGADWDLPQCVAADQPGGDVYITGGFSLSCTFASSTVSSAGAIDAFLAKYDASGNELWIRTAGGANNDLPNGIAIDALGRIYQAGGFASASITFGSSTLTNAGPGFPDIFFVKYDAAGNVIWATREGGGDNDHAVWASRVVNGEVYITGHYHSASFTVGSTTLNNSGMGDVFVMKYDTAGTVMWSKSHGGSDNDFAYSVLADAAGNAWACGMYMSAGVSFGPYSLTNAAAGNEDVFIAKYDSAGAVLWAGSYGGPGDDFANAIALDPAGNLYAAGGFASAGISFGPLTLTNADNTGNTHDVFAAKLGLLTSAPAADGPDFSVYPNPSGALFSLRGARPGAKLSVHDPLGRCVWEGMAETQKHVLDLGPYAPGIYLLRIESQEGPVCLLRLIRR
ncbi:MAG: T9SS type A sorting domain-containing protein [Bacteroidota bacterium]